MNKKSIWACLLGLALPAFVVSCADLRDSDVCYRAARLYCQKACVDPDQAHCIDQQKSICQDQTDLDVQGVNDCSDKWDALSDCAGLAAVDQACVLPFQSSSTTTLGRNVGEACLTSSECNQSALLLCNAGMCSKLCGAGSGCPSASSPESSVCVQNSYCSATCDSRTCPSGWSCFYDTGSGRRVCQK